MAKTIHKAFEYHNYPNQEQQQLITEPLVRVAFSTIAFWISGTEHHHDWDADATLKNHKLANSITDASWSKFSTRTPLQNSLEFKWRVVQ